MAKSNKKQVAEITAMDEDFAQWYTDIVKKAELIEYTSVKGCMVIRPYGYAICSIFWTACLRKPDMKMSACRCLFRKACSKRKRIT